LQVERNAYALVVSTENITLNWYAGDERSMLIPNTLFRMGGAAIVLTNKAGARRRAKYQLQHVTRVHLGADETAYRCATLVYDACSSGCSHGLRVVAEIDARVHPRS